MRNLSRALPGRLACVVGAATVLAGCSSGGGQPSDFCKSVDSLDAAVTQINQSSLSKSTISAVEASLATLDKAVANVSDTVESQFASEVDAVKSAAAGLDKTVSAAVDQPSPTNLAAARDSMGRLTTAVDDLDQAASDSC